MSTYRGMDKEDVVLIYNGILLNHQKNEIMPFAATWMQLEIIILSEVSQKEADIIYCHFYVESKIWHKWICLQKQKETHRLRAETCGCWCRGSGRGMDWEFGIGRCKLLHLEWINNKVLIHSTGNYMEYPVINHNGKNTKKNVYMCVTELLCYTAN